MSLTPRSRLTSVAMLAAGAWFIQACGSSGAPVDRRPTVTASAAELTRITNDPLPEFYPAPSPDGTMLLFNQRDDAKCIALQGGGEECGNARFSIIRQNIGSPARTLVTDEASSMASWFPDNRFFAYDSGRTGSLRIVRSVAAGGGGGMTFMTSSLTGMAEQHAHVSSDGDLIAFNSLMRGDTVIATIEEGSSNVTVYGEGLMPKWSPDGSKLAYFWRDRGTWQLFVMDVAGGAQITQLTASETANNHSPDWSPDGQWLTYISDQDGDDHVYVIRADGTGSTQLTQGRSTEQGPAWSNDNYIYFGSDASGNFDVWRVRPVLGM